MLTIKHVEQDHESIDTCESVSFFPAIYPPQDPQAQVRPTPTRAATLTAFGGSCKVSGEGHSTFGNGTVYVMNDAGKTVGKYDLD